MKPRFARASLEREAKQLRVALSRLGQSVCYSCAGNLTNATHLLLFWYNSSLLTDLAGALKTFYGALYLALWLVQLLQIPLVCCLNRAVGLHVTANLE